MIKEKLMKALKAAAADYNGGMSANAAVVKAADEADFNEKQTERLVEMFNTLAALNKERDADDPTGACELASKEVVAKMLVDGCGNDGCGEEKKASAAVDYSFYSTVPERTNRTIEARESGLASMTKAAFAVEDVVPEELKVSQRSLYKSIESNISQLKQAAAAADDVARNLRMEIDRDAVKVAKAIEAHDADPELADLFKAACEHKTAVSLVSEYSTKVAESDGGRFARMHVFDADKAEDLLKVAGEIEANSAMVSFYEGRRDFFNGKASEAEEEMREAVGIGKSASAVKREELADMFRPVEKSAAPAVLIPTGLKEDSLHDSLSSVGKLDDEKQRLNNVKMSIILADLMTDDPIIRDADPNVVVDAYKTLAMSSPRMALDKTAVKAALRTAVNSVAISPADVKVFTDVDRGIAIANGPAASKKMSIA